MRPNRRLGRMRFISYHEMHITRMVITPATRYETHSSQSRTMPLHPLAGKPAPTDLLIDVDRLAAAYYDRRPDLADPQQRVSFGTSGHRGTSLDGTFTEAHILAIAQAICEYRVEHGITGPVFVGKDTHALSGPAQRTAVEVLAANGVETLIQRDDSY